MLKPAHSMDYNPRGEVEPQPGRGAAWPYPLIALGESMDSQPLRLSPLPTSAGAARRTGVPLDPLSHGRLPARQLGSRSGTPGLRPLPGACYREASEAKPDHAWWALGFQPWSPPPAGGPVVHPRRGAVLLDCHLGRSGPSLRARPAVLAYRCVISLQETAAAAHALSRTPAASTILVLYDVFIKYYNPHITQTKTQTQHTLKPAHNTN